MSEPPHPATAPRAYDWVEDVTSLPLTIALGVPTLVFYACAFFVMPRIEQALKDLRVELPAISQLSLAFARWMWAWGWMVVWLVPLLLPVLMTQLVNASRRTPRAAGRVLWGLNLGLTFSLLIILWFALSILLPWVTLIQSVSAPKQN